MKKYLLSVPLIAATLPASSALKPYILDATRLKRSQVQCPDELVKPYHVYVRAGLMGSFDFLPTFEYGTKAPSSNNPTRFDETPSTFGVSPELALGWRAERNPIVPSLFGDRAKYELNYQNLQGSDDTSLKASSLTVHPINGGAGVTRSFNRALKLDSDVSHHRFRLLIKGNPGHFKPFAGLDFNQDKIEYQVKSRNTTAGDLFSLNEEVKTMFIGPTMGFHYDYPFASSMSLGVKSSLSVFYYDSDLDATQRLAGNTSTATISETGFSLQGDLGLNTKYHFQYGDIGLFGEAAANPLYPAPKNPQSSDKKLEIDTDNTLMTRFGLKLSIHGSKQVKKPLGRCVQI